MVNSKIDMFVSHSISLSAMNTINSHHVPRKLTFFTRAASGKESFVMIFSSSVDKNVSQQEGRGLVMAEYATYLHLKTTVGLEDSDY
jgi:hypothetical protein